MSSLDITSVISAECCSSTNVGHFAKTVGPLARFVAFLVYRSPVSIPKTDRIVAYLSHVGSPKTAKDVASTLGEPLGGIYTLMSFLTRNGRVTRTSRGRYQVALGGDVRGAYTYEELAGIALEAAEAKGGAVVAREVFALANERGLSMTHKNTIGYMHLTRAVELGLLYKTKAGRYMPMDALKKRLSGLSCKFTRVNCRA